MKDLVQNKIVNIKALKTALIEEFKYVDLSDYEDEDGRRFADAVDEFIQLNVEMVAEQQLGLEPADHHRTNIYEVVDNVDQFRDTVNDYIDEKLSELEENNS